MSRRPLFALWLVAITLWPAAAAPEDEDPSGKVRCPVCGMFVEMFADWNATIGFKDSSHVIFDGPKCMFKYFLDMKKYDPSRKKGDVASISVRDYLSAESIDARKAFFVVWSDVYGPMGHEPIPFDKREEAKQFRKEHKGRAILRFGDISPKLLWSLDHP